MRNVAPLVNFLFQNHSAAAVASSELWRHEFDERGDYVGALEATSASSQGFVGLTRVTFRHGLSVSSLELIRSTSFRNNSVVEWAVIRGEQSVVPSNFGPICDRNLGRSLFIELHCFTKKANNGIRLIINKFHTLISHSLWTV